jgi:hypothetical protein
LSIVKPSVARSIEQIAADVFNSAFVESYIQTPIKPKPPEIPPECWRESYGMTRKGVDFQEITRMIALSSKEK